MVKVINRGYIEDGDEPIFFFTCRDEKRDWHIVKVKGIEPRFYVLEEDVEILEGQKRIRRIEPCTVPNTNWKGVSQVFTVLPKDVGSIRKYLFGMGVKTWNGDIPFELVSSLVMGLEQWADVPLDREFLSPEEVKPVPPPLIDIPRRGAYVDIETTNMSKDQLRSGSAPVTHIGCLDSYTKQFHKFIFHPEISGSMTLKYKSAIPEGVIRGYPTEFTVNRKAFKSQRDMLASAVNFIASMHFDDGSGWNSSGGIPLDWKIRKKKHGGNIFKEGFDFQYIYRACRYHGVDTSILSPVGSVYMRPTGELVVKGFSLFDLMHAAEYSTKLVKRRTRKPKNVKLDTIAKFFFGVGKLRHKGTVYDLHMKNPALADKYNTRDIELTYAIDMYLRLKDDFEIDAEISTRSLSDAMFGSKDHDMLTLKKCVGRYVVPTKEYVGE